MSTAFKKGMLILAAVMPLVTALALYLISRASIIYGMKSAISITLIMMLVMGVLCLIYGVMVLAPFLRALFLPKEEREELLEAHGELLITATTIVKVLAIPAMLLAVIGVSWLITMGQAIFTMTAFFTIFVMPILIVLAVFAMQLPIVGIGVFFFLFGITFVMSLPAMLGQLERLLVKRCKLGEFLLSILFLCFPLADVIYLLITKVDNKHALKQGVIYAICFVAMLLGLAGSITAAVQCEKEYSISNYEKRDT